MMPSLKALMKGPPGVPAGAPHLEAVRDASGHARALSGRRDCDSAKLDVEVNGDALAGPGAALGGPAALDVVVHDRGLVPGKGLKASRGTSKDCLGGVASCVGRREGGDGSTIGAGAGTRSIGDGRPANGDREGARGLGDARRGRRRARRARTRLTAASRRVVADADSSVVRLGLATARMGSANPHDDLAAIKFRLRSSAATPRGRPGTPRVAQRRSWINRVR